MSTWYNAHEAILAVVNETMAEAFAEKDIDRFGRTWRDHAKALHDSIPRDLATDWPDLDAIRQRLGPLFVGVTSDTRKAVGWGAELPAGYRPFVIVEA